MYCITACPLFKYNKVHNEGECYRNALDCERRTGDAPALDVPEDPEDDESIEDPALP